MSDVISFIAGMLIGIVLTRGVRSWISSSVYQSAVASGGSVVIQSHSTASGDIIGGELHRTPTDRSAPCEYCGGR